MINRLYERYDFILLNIRETQMKKDIKKILFIFISIIFPLIEIISLILLVIDIKKTKFKDIDSIGDLAVIIIFSFISLIFTWGMVGVCYLERYCIKILLTLKGMIIFASIYICFIISNRYDYRYELYNFYYYLVFYVIGYGIFFTLIIVYKTFPKGII